MALPDDYRAASRSRWGASARGWEGRRDHMRTWSMPVSAWMIDAIDPQPGQTLLELAAGLGDTGLLAAELIAPTGTLICSDFAPEMLDAAQRRAAELGIENVRFKQIDAETSIDLEAASMDGVLCRWGYMLMPGAEHALGETRRVLKPGRRVALAAWTASDDNPWGTAIMRVMIERGVIEPPRTPEPGPFTWAEEGVIAEKLAGAGFVEQHVEAVSFTMDFASAEDWFDSHLAMSASFAAAVQRAGSDDVAAVRRELERQAADFAAEDGTVRVPARTWVAWAAA